jgi:FixJ family two-component response regulator
MSSSVKKPDQFVYVVDDDAAVRKSFSMLMKSVGLKTVLCDSAKAFIEKYDPGKGGCLILDLRMPEMTGLELQALLLEKHIRIPIIIVTGIGDIPTAVKSIHLGAMDFVEKPFDQDKMVRQIKDALEMDAKLREKEEKFQRLTRREHQVMKSLLEGNSNKVTAEYLGISVRTVEVHRAKIMDKLDAKSIADLWHLAREAGLA